jgi:RNA polymerase sigma-70 factor (ECF subfamily)
MDSFEGEFDFVYRSLRRHGVGVADAEDLAQEVFLVMWRRRDHYDPGRPLRAWLGGIAFRLAHDYRRRKGREVPSGFVDAQDEAASADDRVASATARRLVRESLEALAPKHRALLVMHELDGISMHDIAAELDVPLATAYTRLRAARHAFAKEVRRIQTRAVFVRTAAALTTETLLAAEREAPGPAPERKRRVLDRLRRVLVAPGLAPVPPLSPMTPPLGWGRMRPWVGAGMGAALLLAVGLALALRGPAAASMVGPMNLEAGLAGYWRFDDGKGSALVRDRSTTGGHCQMRREANPASDWIPGRLGGALQFGGQGWLECTPTAFRSRIGDELTVAAWTMSEAPYHGLRAVVTRQLDQGRWDYFLLGFHDDRVLFASHLWRSYLKVPVPTQAGWMHLAATHDRRGVTVLYVDGREVARSHDRVVSLGGGDNPLVIGAGRNGAGDGATQRLKGAVDELLLYDRALTAEEVAALARGAQPKL